MDTNMKKDLLKKDLLKKEFHETQDKLAQVKKKFREFDDFQELLKDRDQLIQTRKNLHETEEKLYETKEKLLDAIEENLELQTKLRETERNSRQKEPYDMISDRAKYEKLDLIIENQKKIMDHLKIEDNPYDPD